MEHSAPSVRKGAERLTSAIAVAARGAADKLIRENALTWDQLLALEGTFLPLSVSVALDGALLHATLNTGSAERRISVRKVANPSFGTKKGHVTKNPTKMLETQMTKLVMKTKKHFGLFG